MKKWKELTNEEKIEQEMKMTATLLAGAIVEVVLLTISLAILVNKILSLY
jgi:hypothetical protein